MRMNCFICGKKMKEDWYDGPLSLCIGKDHHFTTQYEELFHFNFTHNYKKTINTTLWFELDIIKKTLKVYQDGNHKNSIDISDMIYWKNFKELESYCNKTLTFQ